MNKCPSCQADLLPQYTSCPYCQTDLRPSLAGQPPQPSPQGYPGQGAPGGFGAPPQGFGPPQQGFGAPQGFGPPPGGGFGPPQGFGPPPSGGAPPQGFGSPPGVGGFGPAPMAGGPGMYAAPPVGEGPNTTTALILSICCALFCCIPGGIYAAYLANEAKNQSLSGNFELAQSKLKTAYIVIAISAVLGLVINGFYIAANS